MEQKLRSVLRIPTLRSASKAVVFAGAVWWARLGALDLLHSLFFVAVASALFFRKPFSEAKAFIVSFAALIVFVHTVPPFASVAAEIAIAVAAGTLFFLLLGMKEVVFFRRKSWYHLFFFSLLLAGNVIFLDRIDGEPFIQPFFFGTLLFMFNEMYAALTPIAERNRRLLISAISALAAFEFVWTVRFLPLSAGDGAALATLLSYAFTNMCVLRFRGALARHHIVRDACLVAGLSAFILIFRSV